MNPDDIPDLTLRELFARWDQDVESAPMAEFADVLKDHLDKPAAEFARRRVHYYAETVLRGHTQLLLGVEAVLRGDDRDLLEYKQPLPINPVHVTRSGEGMWWRIERAVLDELDRRRGPEFEWLLDPWRAPSAGTLHYAALSGLPSRGENHRALSLLNGRVSKDLVRIDSFFLEHFDLLPLADDLDNESEYDLSDIINEHTPVLDSDSPAVVETAMALMKESDISLDELFSAARALERT